MVQTASIARPGFSIRQAASTKVSVAFGRNYGYNLKGHLRHVACLATIYSEDGDPYCNISVTFSKSGKIEHKFTHKLRCTHGCGEFRPLLKPGEYRVIASSLRVREKPDLKGKYLFSLKNQEKINVTKDTHKIVTIGEETAPWVKIKTADGKEGYVFGGYIRAKDEPYVDLSKYK